MLTSERSPAIYYPVTMSKLAYGLNVTKKAPSGPGPVKRKTIFDSDSDAEDNPNPKPAQKPKQALGGLQSTSSKPSSKAPKVCPNGNLAAKHSASKHTQTAQSLDPSIYDYDGVYDSLHSGPKPSSTDLTNPAEPKKPRYMTQLLAASEVRKRDAVRAKEKMLAKEREAEGDDFIDKEQFVTAAYKRQQAAMREAEADEEKREKEAEERKRREGGGMKQLYKGMLEKDEERHQVAMKQAEEVVKKGPLKEDPKVEANKDKSETELAKEKGAVINEEGQVVDKRQLLGAGLNAGAGAAKVAAREQRTGDSRGGRGGDKISDRDRETRAFEEQLLGKRGASDDEDGSEEARAAKSRKMEDDILNMIRR